MDKIAQMLKLDDVKDVSEIRSFMVDQNEKFAACYSNCLKKGVEQYLGRAIDIQNDAERLSANHQNNGNVEYFVDGVLIGRMTVDTGLDGNDFINNKISIVFKWTPVFN